MIPLRRFSWSTRRLSAYAVALAAALGALTFPSILGGQVMTSVTINAQTFGSGAEIPEFTFLISEDNAARNTDPVNLRAGVKETPSYIPLVAAGDQDTGPISLESGDTCGEQDNLPCRYLVTVKAPGHKLWGKHFTLPADAPEVVVQLKTTPLKLGRIVVRAFEDRQPVNAAPGFDVNEPGLEGFEVRLHDTVGEMQADYFGDPLCGGQCLTGPDGEVTIPNIAPGKYEVEVLPPDGSDWIQTTTFEGGHAIDWCRIAENEPGTCARDEATRLPQAEEEVGVRTSLWFGFVHVPTNDLPSCTECGSISGTARNWVGWPPYDQIYFSDPVKNAVVALSSTGTTDEQVYTDFADPDTGEFLIENIPPGSYTLSIFDENLDYIIRYVYFTIPEEGGHLDLNVPGGPFDADGNPTEVGVPVARWFGWVSGHVFEDNGLDANSVAIDPLADPPLDNNGVRDCDPGNPLRCEEGIDGMDLDIRFTDGSVRAGTFTGPNPDPFGNGESGFYEYPELLNKLSKFWIWEVGFPRFARTGMSLHDEFDPTDVDPLPDDLGGGLLLNQLTAEGHRSWIDAGKREYELDDPATPAYEGEHGGITGIVFYATTRNEFDPALAAAEDYEPAIPGVRVKLWGLAPGGNPADANDYTVPLNAVDADAWERPGSANGQSCPVRDAFGAVLPPFTPDIAAECIEFATLSNQVKDGAFDGGYAIETMCLDPDFDPDAEQLAECQNEELLPPGDYVVEVVPPPYYQVIKEEDQNTDEGDDLIPQIPPPPCVGPPHLVNDPRNPADGEETPLCTKKLVTLEDGQNPAGDFFLFTDVDDDPTTNTAADGSWNTVESVAPPGRIFGFVGDDLRFETNQSSPWYGQPLPLTNIPVGVYDFEGRQITMLHTDTHGFYDVTLPSTQTYNCPTPSGVCPGVYELRQNDASDPAYNPDYLATALNFDVWPGKTTYADTPVDPISATTCNLGTVPDPNPVPPAPGDPPLFFGYQFPEFWKVDPNPYYTRSGTGAAAVASRNLTLTGAGFGDTRGSGAVTIGGNELPASAYTSWSDKEIEITIPNTWAGALPGPRQLLIRAANGGTTPVGITIHVLGTGYNPSIRHVRKTPAAGEYSTIQAAMNAGNADNALIVVHPGTYAENVIMHRRVKLQGVGPGGSIGSPESGAGTTIDDIRLSATGSVIDARNFWDRVDAWTAQLTAQPIAGDDTVPGGAAITVVPRSTGQFGTGLNAAIDGFGITMGQGGGAGGVQVNAYARRLEIANNIMENNGGDYGGAIAVGLPTIFPTGGAFNPERLNNENDDVRIAYNRILGNGANAKFTGGGGIAIYNGAERYLIEQNDFCANYSGQYGGGILHYGLSGGQTTSGAAGRILDNRIYGNDAFDSGGGLMIRGEYAPGTAAPQNARGSGRVDVERNFISSNLSNDDGGGVMLLDTLGTAPTSAPGSTTPHRIAIGSNIIAHNVATDVGGGMTMDDAHNVTIVNNTFTGNATTDTAEDRNFLPNGAGLVSETGAGGTFSEPVAFFNNIFWNNIAFTWDPTDPAADDMGLVDGGFIDLEVYGTAGVLDPRYSLLTDGLNTTNHASNVVGVDPVFVLEYDVLESLVIGNARVTGEFQTTLVRMDPPPPGHDGLPGDSHITPGSPACGAGIGLWAPGSPISGGYPRPNPDIDGDGRGAPTAFATPDIGADEIPGPTCS